MALTMVLTPIEETDDFCGGWYVKKSGVESEVWMSTHQADSGNETDPVCTNV